MYVLCDECHTHYDDASQSPKCDGPGTGRGHGDMRSRPITEHRIVTSESWRSRKRKTRPTATETARAATNTPSLVPDATD